MSNEWSKVGIIADSHCGSCSGLTHPDFQWRVIKGGNKERNKFAKMQELMYSWVKDEAKKVGDLDVLVINGDIIEGSGDINRGFELIDNDQLNQVAIAHRTILSLFPCKNIRVIEGTPYHDGKQESYSKEFARQIQTENWARRDRFRVCGLQFDVRHKVGGGSIPHTAYSGIAKEQMMEKYMTDYYEIEQNANIIIRSHQHKWRYIEGMFPNSCSFVTPCLKGLGEGYAEREGSGVVDVGFIIVYVKNEFEWKVEKHFMPIRFMIPNVEDAIKNE